MTLYTPFVPNCTQFGPETSATTFSSRLVSNNFFYFVHSFALYFLHRLADPSVEHQRCLHYDALCLFCDYGAHRNIQFLSDSTVLAYQFHTVVVLDTDGICPHVFRFAAVIRRISKGVCQSSCVCQFSDRILLLFLAWFRAHVTILCFVIHSIDFFWLTLFKQGTISDSNLDGHASNRILNIRVVSAVSWSLHMHIALPQYRP